MYVGQSKSGGVELHDVGRSGSPACRCQGAGGGREAGGQVVAGSEGLLVGWDGSYRQGSRSLAC